MEVLSFSDYARVLKRIRKLERISDSTPRLTAIKRFRDLGDALARTFWSTGFTYVDDWRELRTSDAWQTMRKVLESGRDGQCGPKAHQISLSCDEFKRLLEEKVGATKVFVPSGPRIEGKSAWLGRIEQWSGGFWTRLPEIVRGSFERSAAALAYGEGSVAAALVLLGTEGTLRMFCRHQGAHDQIDWKPHHWSWGPMVDWCIGKDLFHNHPLTNTLGDLRSVRNLALHCRIEFPLGGAQEIVEMCCEVSKVLLQMLNTGQLMSLKIKTPWPPSTDLTFASWLLANCPQENGAIDFTESSDAATFDLGGRWASEEIAKLFQLDSLLEPVLTCLRESRQTSRRSLAALCEVIARRHDEPTQDWLRELDPVFQPALIDPSLDWAQRGSHPDFGHLFE